MSAVVKAAKVARYIFAAVVVLFVLFAISAYMQADSINKAYIEDIASKTLGVPVTIGEMDVLAEKKLVKLKDIKIANPAGYKGPHAATADSAEINVDTFELERVTFNLVTVKGFKVFLEMNSGSTNLHDLKKQTAQNVRNIKPDGKHDKVRVIVRTITYEKPVLQPVVTLVPTAIGALGANDVFVRDIGTQENGIAIPQAIAKIVQETVSPFHLMANQAELLKGMSLETLNLLGVSTYDVFKKNVNKKINKDLNEAQKLLNTLVEEGAAALDSATSELTAEPEAEVETEVEPDAAPETDEGP